MNKGLCMVWEKLFRFHVPLCLNSFFSCIFEFLEAVESAKDQSTSDGGAMDTKLAGFLKVNMHFCKM